METRGGKKRDNSGLDEFVAAPPLKPKVIIEAHEKSEFKLSVTNRTKHILHVCCEVGNSWDWEKIRPQGTVIFPSHVPTPYLAASYSAVKGNEYHEACATCDAALTYELVQTSAKGAFKVVVSGSDDGAADMARSAAEETETKSKARQQQAQHVAAAAAAAALGPPTAAAALTPSAAAAAQPDTGVQKGARPPGPAADAAAPPQPPDEEDAMLDD